jgi:hypothetical protein
MDVPQALSEILPRLLGPVADGLAVECGFTQRNSKISGGAFAAALVGCWLSDADARLHEFGSTLAGNRVEVTPQAVDQRFSEAAVELFRRLLETAVGEVVSADPAPLSIADRFPAVTLFDCTQVALPEAFAEQFPGCGGGNTKPDRAATLKVSVGWELHSGSLCHLSVHPGRTHDRATLPPPESLAPGTLRLADLGYFSLSGLAELGEAEVHWLTRLQANTRVWYEGCWYTQPEFLEEYGPRSPGETARYSVLLGKTARLPAELLLERVPEKVAAERREELVKKAERRRQKVSPERLQTASFSVLVTDLDETRLTVGEAFALYHLRWRIELLFRCWKSVGGLGQSRSRKPLRMLCELFAKLLVLVLQHWLMLTSDWRGEDASWHKAAEVVRIHGRSLVFLLDCPVGLLHLLYAIGRSLRSGCTVSRRRDKPSTFQRLLMELASCLA